MRKFICSFGLVCTVAAAAFLGGCNKNSDKCCDGDKAQCAEKAGSVKTDAQATPAATPGCCKEKAAAGGKCCNGEKKVCPSTGQSN